MAVIFFGIGEWQGWYLGLAGQTPLLVYKKDFTAESTRRTLNRNELPVNLTGNVKHGNVTVRIHFARPMSIQTGASALPEKVVFERSFSRGQRVAINELVQEGRGNYRIEIDFEEATGVFRLRLPTAAEL
jgi:hypothetical protein